MNEPPIRRTKTSRLRHSADAVESPAAAHPSSPAAGAVPSNIVEQITAAMFTVPAPLRSPIEQPGLEPLVPLPGTTLHLWDVVQVCDPSSRHYGMFFIVGDAKHGKVHGFYLAEGSRKEFLTIPIEHVHYTGRSKVRARVACSPKWLSDNK